MVGPEDIAVGRMYPPLKDIQSVSLKIANIICENAYKDGKYIEVAKYLECFIWGRCGTTTNR